MFGCHGGFGNCMLGFGAPGFGILGVVLLIIFLALIIAGIVALVLYLGRSQKGEKSTADILKERYAKGEINKEEFDKMMKDIGSNR